MTDTTDSRSVDPHLDAARLVGLLADDDRRLAFAAVQLGAGSLDDVARLAALPTARAAKALASLASAGLVVQGHDGGPLVVLGQAFAMAARAALARPRSSEHAEQPDDVRRVLDAFVRDGRLVQIPTARPKRLVVLDWLAQDFEPGVRYSEPMVNLVLGKRNADTAALRRYLVDEGIMARSGGEYWRIGGTVDTAGSAQRAAGDEP
jgi:hypothetical protein